MKSFFKKSTALFLGLCMTLYLTGCSNQKWSVKTNNISMSMGAYITFLRYSYNEALQKTTSSNTYTSKSTSIAKLKVDEQNASDWIKEKTLEKCKRYLFIEYKFNELGLSISDESMANVESQIETSWGRFGSQLEKWGISRDSFLKVAGLYPEKEFEVFKAMYGKDGEFAVSDDELKEYYKNNYMNLSVLTKDLTKTNDESGEKENLADNEITKIKNDIESNASKFNNGNLKADDINNAYKTDANPTPLKTQTYKLDQLTFPEELNEKIKSSEIGKAFTFYDEDKAYLVIKNSLDKELEALNEDDTTHYNILGNMKMLDFEEYMNNSITNMKFTVNKRGITKFPATMFESTSTSAN